MKTMEIVVTGMGYSYSDGHSIIEETLNSIRQRAGKTRFIHDIEKCAVTAVSFALDNAGIAFPSGRDDIGLFMGIDDSVEDVKDDFFRGVLGDGIYGASPLMFPFTSPNAFSAQITIVFDIRGECVLMPVNYSFEDVIKYAAVCIRNGYTKTAVSGGVLRKGNNVYEAGFFVLENAQNAKDRGATVYCRL
ncbi:hypothetical protein [Candidatus Magnetominusculus dajiuhuensis]|uniref:hypothetical protein n=1 Tax=Candidatus Magnetominusculus dajiuhuensis TaxID=3137712 RepID=UPI003B43CAE2